MATTDISQSLHITTPSSRFQSIFNDAMNAYRKQTKKDLVTHPLAARLQFCDSPAAILAVLQDQVQDLNQSRMRDERFTRWLNPTVNVLYAFSVTLGEGVGLVFSPAKTIFAGIGVLLLAARDVSASHDALIDLFERIESFFKRLETYTEVPPTMAMTEIIVKIMVEVLSILAIATKQIKQGRTKKYMKKLVGRTDVEDGLKRLDKLTQDEARMATTQLLKITHNVNEKVMGVSGQVKSVNDRVKGVDDKVGGIGYEVENVNHKVKGVSNKVKDVDNKVKVIINGGKEAKVIMQQTANSIDNLKWNQMRDNIRKWLSHPDPSINHNIACDAHHKGTAEWFFQGSAFNEWKSTGSLLWVHGKPGSGKSILCSTIIQDIVTLRDAGLASLAYFYFDFRDADKQSRRNLLSSLLTQLSARSDPCCDILSQLYTAHDSGAQKPTDGALTQCLNKMLTLLDHDPIYIIVDALDECPNASGMPSPREQVLDLVKELVNLSLPSLHICVTSRPEIDIRDVLKPLTSCRMSLHDQGGQKRDILKYVRSVVHSDIKMQRWRDEDKNLVIGTLSERADGMFRWVFCQLETLRHCLPPSVRRTLNELPESLDETYERMLKEIKKPNQVHTHRLLQCLTVAVRPLHVEELADILAVDFDDAEGPPQLNLDWRWEDQEQAVLSACSSLVSIVRVDGSRVVQFSHFSVKEFLTSDRLTTSNVSRYRILSEPAHTVLAQACLGALLRLDLPINGSRTKSIPLAGYAARHWVSHAHFGNVSSHIRAGMECLFDPDKSHFPAWVNLYDIDQPMSGSFDFPFRDHWHLVGGMTTPLYYSALCGFRDLAEYLILKYPKHVNTRTGRKLSALGGALSLKHFQVAELLFQHGADINVRGELGWTLLHAASIADLVDVGQWLLDHGADLNSRQYGGWTPLTLAAVNRCTKAVQMLLDYGADINVQCDQGRTALHGASKGSGDERRDNVSVVRLLLKHGADVDARDGCNSTPLHLAASNGILEVARVLLEHGAKVDAEDNERKTPFQKAVTGGHHKVARLLLEYSAERRESTQGSL